MLQLAEDQSGYVTAILSRRARLPVSAAEQAVTRAGGVVLDMAYFTAREDNPAAVVRRVAWPSCNVLVLSRRGID